MNARTIVEQLGWVLIHSLWQFAAMALVAGLVVWMLRRSSSSARYGAWVIAMSGCVAAPVLTWMVLPIEPPTEAVATSLHLEEAITPLVMPVPDELPVSQEMTSAGDLPSQNMLSGDPQFVPAAVAMEAVPPTWSEWATNLLRPWMTWIVAGWCIGVMLCSLRPLLGWYTLLRLRTVGVAAVTDDIRMTLRRVSDRLGLQRTVEVLQSTLTAVPLVVGYLRPVILLPVSLLTNMPPSQLEAILAHELAHIRRHDFVVNLLQTLVETLCFYHPAVWWLSRQIRVEREHCCDDLVVSALGNRVEYGRALLAIEELRCAQTVLALGANDGSLLSRIRRIVGFRADRTASSQWPGIVLVMCLFGFVASISVLGWTAPAENDPVAEAVDENESETETKPPTPAVAEWKDGKSLEFVGITKNTALAKEGWLPSGLPIGDVGYWKSTTVLHGGNTTATYVENGPHPEPDADALDFLFRFRGLKAQPSLTFEMPTTGIGYSHWPVTDPYELRVSGRRRGAPPPGATWSTPDGVARIGVTDEPWGRYVKISPDGEVLDPIQPGELYASTYKLIQILGSKPHNRISTGKAVVLRAPVGQKDPRDPDHQYAWEFRAIDNEGKERWAIQWEGRENESQYGLAQPLPAGRTLSHYEYRMRPYRHWVTFENVSLQPGPQTDVKITAKIWAEASSQVKVLDANGQPATFNSLVDAQVGYPLKPQRSWLGWREKTGLVSLETLPVGEHWIVAAAEFEQRSIFRVANPSAQKLVEWRLRSSEPWTQKDLEFKPRFDEATSDIVVAVNNKFDEPLTLSEADFHLVAGERTMVRGMSPQWADGKFTPVEIAAGQTGEMRLNWNDWVRKGFWATRDGESISEPTLPPDEPGRIYVRVSLGNSGALPIAVIDPALILPQAEGPKDERTSLLESLIKTPQLETFQKLLKLAEGQHPEVTELLDDSRRHAGKEKMGGEVKVVSNGQERLAIVSANVIPLIEPSDVAVRVDPDRRAECAFVFDMQGRLIDTLGGTLAGGNSLGGDNIHIVNLGPEEDWFVRVMNFEKRGEFTYRSDYYRVANPVVKSMRFYNLPNACSWSNGPEKIPRQGRLHPSHPQAERRFFAGVPKEIPVTTAAGIPTVSAIVWDGDRNRFLAAPSAFVKGLPLYEVDTIWSHEFDPLEPQPGQLTIEGGIREFDHWYAWETVVPDTAHAVTMLTIPRQERPQTVIVEIPSGRHTIQLQAKPKENGQGVHLKLLIDEDRKYDFELPFAFGEAIANHPPIVQVVKPNESARLVHRLLQDTTAALMFEIKLEAPPPEKVADGSLLSTMVGAPANTLTTVKAEATLNELIDAALEVNSRRILTVGLHSPWQIVHSLRAGGSNAMLQTAGTSSRRIKALDWLSNGAQWNKEPVWRVTEHGAEGHPFTKPFAFQGQPGQFLAALADANVPMEHVLTAFNPAGEAKLVTVRDLVQDARQKVNDREVMSWLLRALSHYESPAAEWKTAAGEVWSIERLVRHEVRQNTRNHPASGVWVFSGLGHALNRYKMTRTDKDAPLPPPWSDAQERLAHEIEAAKSGQDPDHFFSFGGKQGLGTAQNFTEFVRANGGTLSWMVVAMSPDELRDPIVSRAVEALAQGLILHSRESTDVGAWSNAVYALRLYREKTRPPVVEPQAEAQREKPSRGTLRGRFVYDGDAPKPREISPNLVKLTADSPVPRDSNGRVSGVTMHYLDYLKAGIRPRTDDLSLQVDKDGGIANVIVWVASQEIPWTRPAEAKLPPVTIRGMDGHFSPRISLLTVGQELVVENKDPLVFNFHANFGLNPSNQIIKPVDGPGATIRITMKHAESLPSPYGSDIAPWATGYLVVRNNPHAAVSQSDGTFIMPDLPPGEWEFRVWHERRGYVAHWPKGLFKHTIQPGENDLGTIKLKPELFAGREPMP